MHRVAFLDKPFIRSHDLTPKDKNQLFQKHAIRAFAKRPQNRGHVFVGVKPVHTVDKAPQLEDLKKELEMYEEGLKECMGAGVKEKSAEAHSDEESERNRDVIIVGEKNRKGSKKNQKLKEGGMFDIDTEDFDDLETFGMDKTLRSKDAEDGCRIKSPRTSIDVCVSHSKERPSQKVMNSPEKPVKDELEMLKQELQLIKSQAKFDSLRKTVYHSVTVVEEASDPHESRNDGTSTESFKSIKEEGTKKAVTDSEIDRDDEGIAVNVASELPDVLEDRGDRLKRDNSEKLTDVGNLKSGTHKTDECFNKATGDNTFGDTKILESTGMKHSVRITMAEQKIDVEEKVNATDIQSASDTKSGEGVESRKSLPRTRRSASDLSKKMQQMSMIKSRLRQRSVEGKNSAGKTTMGNTFQTGANTHTEEMSQTTSKIAKASHNNQEVEKTVKHSTDIVVDEDSDNDSDGLVIDLPSDTSRNIKPVVQNTKAKRGSQILNLSVGEQDLDSDDNKKSDPDSNGGGKNIETAINTRGSKRRSSRNSVRDGASSPKKSLKQSDSVVSGGDGSGTSSNEVETRTAGKAGMDDKDLMDEEMKGEIQTDHSKPCRGRGRGRKRTVTQDDKRSVYSKNQVLYFR